MPKEVKGDFTHVFEATVPNLDWLQVDEEVYRQIERLPKQNLKSVPDLVDAWTYHDKGTPHVIPAVDPDAIREHKLASELKFAEELKVAEESRLREVVSLALKERMMLGWGAPQLAAWVRENVHPDHVAMLIPTLKRVAQEHALVGNMTREVVFDIVPQEDALIDEYHAKLDIPNTADDQLDEFLASQAPAFKPMSGHASMGPQDQRDRKSKGLYEPPKTAFKNPIELRLYRDLSQKMMAAKGHLSTSLLNRFASSEGPAIQTLLKEKNLLGSIYVRVDQFSSCHLAKDFFHRHKIGAEYVLETKKCAGCTFHRGSGCSLTGKQVVTEVPYNDELLTREIHAKLKSGTIHEATATKLLKRVGTMDTKTLLAEVLSTSDIRDNTYTKKYDTTAVQSSTGKDESFVESPGAIPHRYASVVQAAYRASYQGVHGDALRSQLLSRFASQDLIAAGEYLKPIVRMSSLLGNVVLDMRGFRSAKEASQFLTKNNKHPRFILKEGCGCGGPRKLDHSKKFPGLTIINYGSIGEVEVEVDLALDQLEKKSLISTKVASNLRSRIGSDNNWDILRTAYSSPRPEAHKKIKRKALSQEHRILIYKGLLRQAQTGVENEPSREDVLQALIDPNFSVAASYQVTLGEDLSNETLLELSKEAGLTSDQLQGHVKQIALATEAKNVEALRGLISQEALNGSISQKFAATLIAEAGKTSGSEILLKLAREQIVHIGKGHTPSIDYTPTGVFKETVVAAKVVKISSTQRIAFQKKLIMAMNKGLEGDALKSWLRYSYTNSLLRDQRDYIGYAIKDQDQLGNHYIDPRPYANCEMGAKQVAKSPAPYVKEMDKCKGCVYQNANDRCIRYDRKVVSEIPEMEILPEVVREEVPLGIDPAVEYGLDNLLAVNINGAQSSNPQDIMFDDPMGDLL